ncbi:amidase family protein [Fodinicola feengrottensis]|uniref:Amidase family protein n=1 Tax=Fodinicola feengrottensis TaxID=435914 RepID=A0ABN2GJM2_9ACTN|nr:amidase family protein [Fodinicola feengrottensis]
MADLLFQSATHVAGMIKRGEITSRELTERLLSRIDEHNPRINALVELRRERALRDADAADRALMDGTDVGPLHGVPITIKDAFNVADMHTTWGNAQFSEYVAETDAAVVARLTKSGAIIVGKDNLAFMLADFGQTSNDLYGTTVNPWDSQMSPGGSSGGAAAAVAAGISFLGYGSDLAGSIRIPASMCGVYGLKPSAGIVPLAGFQPPGPPPKPNSLTFMSALGPIARSAADLRTALAVTAGPDGATGDAWSWSLPTPRRSRLSDFRVGVVYDDPTCPTTAEVGDRLSDVVDTIARSGAHVAEGWPTGVDPAAVYESFGFHVQAFFAFQEPGSSTTKLSEFIEHDHRRASVEAAWERYFADFDVFLCPTSFTTAFAHDFRPFPERTIATDKGERPYTDLSFWTAHASLPGLPAVSAPVGLTPGGLPVGCQIIGPRLHDDTPITFAELLADHLGGYQPPPL